MGIHITADDLVLLPRLDASGAALLGEALLAQASQAGELPQPIEKARAQLVQAHAQLGKALNSRRFEAPGEHSAQAHDADRALDNAWTALHNLLTGWASLPGEGAGSAEKAKRVLEKVFPEELSFLQLPYKVEYSESAQRLATINEGGFEADIRELGGGIFLKVLRGAHRVYGEVLGLSAQAQSSTGVGELRDAMHEFVHALRVYVLKVSAHVEQGDPASEQLADQLLAPLAEWRRLNDKPG